MNYLLKYKDAIMAISKRTDIDGLGGKKPPIDIAVDVLHTNANAAVTGQGVFVECGLPRENKDAWAEVIAEKNAAKAAETYEDLYKELLESIFGK